MDIRIDNETFSKAFGCLNEANAMLESGIGDFSKLDASAMNLVGLDDLGNKSRLDFMSEECDLLYANMKNTITKLMTMDETSIYYFRDHFDTVTLKEILGTAGMVGTKFFEGFLTAGEQIVDGFASIGGFLVGLVDKDAKEKVGQWVSKDHIGDAFEKAYAEGGFLNSIEQNSLFSSQSTGANVIKGFGTAAGYIAAVAVTGGTVSAVSGGSFAAGAAVGVNSIALDAASAAIGGLGGGTEDALQSGMSYDDALKQGMKEGAVQGAFAGGVGLGVKGLAKVGGNVLGKISGANLIDDAVGKTDDLISKGKVDFDNYDHAASIENLIEDSTDVSKAADTGVLKQVDGVPSDKGIPDDYDYAENLKAWRDGEYVDDALKPDTNLIDNTASSTDDLMSKGKVDFDNYDHAASIENLIEDSTDVSKAATFGLTGLSRLKSFGKKLFGMGDELAESNAKLLTKNKGGAHLIKESADMTGNKAVKGVANDVSGTSKVVSGSVDNAKKVGKVKSAYLTDPKTGKRVRIDTQFDDPKRLVAMDRKARELGVDVIDDKMFDEATDAVSNVVTKSSPETSVGKVGNPEGVDKIFIDSEVEDVKVLKDMRKVAKEHGLTSINDDQYKALKGQLEEPSRNVVKPVRRNVDNLSTQKLGDGKVQSAYLTDPKTGKRVRVDTQFDDPKRLVAMDRKARELDVDVIDDKMFDEATDAVSNVVTKSSPESSVIEPGVIVNKETGEKVGTLSVKEADVVPNKKGIPDDYDYADSAKAWYGDDLVDNTVSKGVPETSVVESGEIVNRKTGEKVGKVVVKEKTETSAIKPGEIVNRGTGKKVGTLLAKGTGDNSVNKAAIARMIGVNTIFESIDNIKESNVNNLVSDSVLGEVKPGVALPDTSLPTDVEPVINPQEEPGTNPGGSPGTNPGGSPGTNPGGSSSSNSGGSPGTGGGGADGSGVGVGSSGGSGITSGDGNDTGSGLGVNSGSNQTSNNTATSNGSGYGNISNSIVNSPGAILDSYNGAVINSNNITDSYNTTNNYYTSGFSNVPNNDNETSTTTVTENTSSDTLKAIVGLGVAGLAGVSTAAGYTATKDKKNKNDDNEDDEDDEYGI